MVGIYFKHLPAAKLGVEVSSGTEMTKACFKEGAGRAFL
jgi:hypothetical protein